MDQRIVHKRKAFFSKVGRLYPQYDFSEFVYDGAREKSIVVCPDHGPFLTHANSIYQGKEHLCQECSKLSIRLTTTQFISKCAEVHKGQYKYDLNEVRDSLDTTMLNITCSTHGVFKQRRGAHLRGAGCPSCYRGQLSAKSKLGVRRYFATTVDDRFAVFLRKALTKFGDRYDYSEVVFSNSRTKVQISCPDHGQFLQSPSVHLDSLTGCPCCSKDNQGFDYIAMYSNGKTGEEIGTFYKLLFTHIPTGIKFIKIGITIHSVGERYKKGYSEFEYVVLEQVQTTNLECAIMEQSYKNDNIASKFHLPASIHFTGRTECYCFDEVQQLKSKAVSFLRDSLLEKQGGVCAICGRPPIRPVLDHDHKKIIKGSSLCRGTLCSSCNVLLAKVENNAVRYGFTQDEIPDVIRSIAAYKESEHTKFIHPSEAEKPKKLMLSSYNKLKRAVPASIRVPEFPKSGKMTVGLQTLFTKYNIEPEYYK